MGQSATSAHTRSESGRVESLRVACKSSISVQEVPVTTVEIRKGLKMDTESPTILPKMLRFCSIFSLGPTQREKESQMNELAVLNWKTTACLGIMSTATEVSGPGEGVTMANGTMVESVMSPIDPMFSDAGVNSHVAGPRGNIQRSEGASRNSSTMSKSLTGVWYWYCDATAGAVGRVLFESVVEIPVCGGAGVMSIAGEFARDWMSKPRVLSWSGNALPDAASCSRFARVGFDAAATLT
jgi:hypothetical protein